MSDVRLALLGTSGFAKSYIEVAKKSGAEFAWIHSRDKSRAENFSKSFNIPKFTDNLSAILDDKTISGVVICTEPSRHIDLAVPILDSGMSVLIEKPLDIDADKARLFYEKYQGMSHKISVSSPKRFDPILIKMKKLFDNKREDQCALALVTLLWSRDEAYYKAGNGWRAKESSVLLNQAIHWIDVCHWFFGDVDTCSTQSVSSQKFLECSDQSLLQIKYKNNIQVSLIASTALSKKYPDRFEIYFADQKLSYQDFLRNSRFKNKVLSRFQPTSLQEQLSDFVKSIRENKMPTTTLQSGMAAMQTALGSLHR